jgi:hypothetical protein
VRDFYSYRVVQFAFVFFFTDIPFKGNQSLSNSRSPAPAVSYRTSGVNDTAEVAPTVSLTPLGVILNQVCISESAEAGPAVRVSDTAEAVPAVSNTSLRRHQRCH